MFIAIIEIHVKSLGFQVTGSTHWPHRIPSLISSALQTKPWWNVLESIYSRKVRAIYFICFHLPISSFSASSYAMLPISGWLNHAEPRFLVRATPTHCGEGNSSNPSADLVNPGHLDWVLKKRSALPIPGVVQSWSMTMTYHDLGARNPFESEMLGAH